MSEENKILSFDVVVKYLISFFIGAIICFLIVYFGLRNSQKSFYHHFSNGLFVAGVCLASIGGLSLVSKEGFFDVLQFGFKQLGETIKYGILMKKEARVVTDLHSFKEEKRAKRVAKFHFFIVGLVYIFVALVVLFQA